MTAEERCKCVKDVYTLCKEKETNTAIYLEEQMYCVHNDIGMVVIVRANNEKEAIKDACLADILFTLRDLQDGFYAVRDGVLYKVSVTGHKLGRSDANNPKWHTGRKKNCPLVAVSDAAVSPCDKCGFIGAVGGEDRAIGGEDRAMGAAYCQQDANGLTAEEVFEKIARTVEFCQSEGHRPHKIVVNARLKRLLQESALHSNTLTICGVPYEFSANTHNGEGWIVECEELWPQEKSSAE